MTNTFCKFYKDPKIFAVTPISIIFFLFLIPTHSANAASMSFGFGSYSTGDSQVGVAPVNLTYNDSPNVLWQNNKIDNITVTVKSTSDPTGIPLTLFEINPITGLPDPNSGIFRDTNLILMNGTNLFHMTDLIHVYIVDPQANASNILIDQLPITIISNSSNAIADPGLSFNLNETGVNAGIFSGNFLLTSGPSSGNSLHAVLGDEITVQDLLSGYVMNGLVLPNPKSDVGAILVHPGDILTASYGGLNANASITDQSGIPGGGSGGLVVQPGLVADVLAAVGGSPYVVLPPSFGGNYYHFSDGLTLTQGKNKTILDISHYNQELPRQVMKAGDKVNMTFKTFESYNSEGVIHVGLFVIPRGLDMISSNSIASITWEKGKPIEVIDPDHNFSNATASSNSDGTFQYTTFSFTPAKSYEKMSFLARAWNDHRYSTDVRVHDDIEPPKPQKTLPEGVIRYDNFEQLQEALSKDKFYKPEIMAHIHDTKAVFPETGQGNVYWLYNTIDQSVTLVISDVNDNELFSHKSNLQPLEVEKKGDYGFMNFTVQQLNRQDEERERQAMEEEASKAMSVISEQKIVRHSNW
jgi:hypothetical protein